MTDFSAVVPVHQEAGTLESFVEDFLRLMKQEGFETRCREVFLIENGSSDGTKAACARLAAAHPVVKTLSIGERSYGEALRQGILRVSGKYLVILECDFLDFGFVKQALKYLDEDTADFILSSKNCGRVGLSRPFTRRVLTSGFNGLLKKMSGYPGSDTRGLKAGTAELFRELTGLAQTGGEIFQTELVLLAWKTGRRIREIPLPVPEKRRTRFGVIPRSFSMLPALYSLRKSLSRFRGWDSE